jgi:hypothetical protein
MLVRIACSLDGVFYCGFGSFDSQHARDFCTVAASLKASAAFR